MTARAPKIALVGRPNVGKSSVLNMLAQRKLSIVAPRAGVTRDRVGAMIALPPAAPDDGERQAEVIDTGGFGAADAEDASTRAFSADVAAQLAFALDEADLVVLVVDAQAGLLPLDEQIAREIRRGEAGAAGRVLVAANKADGPEWDAAAEEAASLGFGDPIPVSTTAGRGRHGLLEAARGALDALAPDDDPGDVAQGPRVAIVGKRNAGKSTLINALVGANRVIVSETAGTTRDAVDVPLEAAGRRLTLIDTAGLRKRSSTRDSVEALGRHRALRSIRRADVCLFLIDAAVPVSRVDKQLAAEIAEQEKPTVLVLSKWDLAEENHTGEEYAKYLTDALKGLSFAPLALVSGLEGEGLDELCRIAVELHDQAGTRVPTGELNRAVQTALAERPMGSGGRGKVRYATQVDVHPPTISLFVNDPDLFDQSARRYLLNRIREELPFPEVPLRLNFRSAREAPAEAAGRG